MQSESELSLAREKSKTLHRQPLAPQQKDWSGYKFNKLTVSHYAYRRGRQFMWVCYCDCGNEVIRRPSGLYERPNTSCDDCRYGSNTGTWDGVGELSKTIFSALRNRATNKGHNFEVSLTYLWELYLAQDRKCALTGWDLFFGKGTYSKDRTASLDRIDSSRGYVEGNLQWVHRNVNYMKREYPNDKFITMCQLVAENNSDLEIDRNSPPAFRWLSKDKELDQ